MSRQFLARSALMKAFGELFEESAWFEGKQIEILKNKIRTIFLFNGGSRTPALRV